MRIAFTGPESSGKTTLSHWLANELPDSVHIAEFARTYLEEQNIVQVSEDHFKQIIEAQCEHFSRSSRNLYQIFDTDIFVLRIWNNEVFKLKLPELEILPSHKMDIHFLCAPDVEWEEDPLRSAPNQDYRDNLFFKYKTELIQHQARFIILEGSLQRKKEIILQSIHEFKSNQ